MIAIVGATGDVGGNIAAVLAQKNEPVRVIERTANVSCRLRERT